MIESKDHREGEGSKEDISQNSKEELKILSQNVQEGMAARPEEEHKIRALMLKATGANTEAGLKSWEETLENKVHYETLRTSPTMMSKFLDGYGINQAMQDFGFGTIGNIVIDTIVGQVPERYYFMTKVATTMAVNQALLYFAGAASAGALTVLSLKLDVIKKKVAEVSKKVDTIIEEPMKTAGDHFLRAIYHIEAGDYEETLPEIREAINNSLKALNYIKGNKKYMNDVVTCVRFLALGDQLMEKYDKENKIFLPYDILPPQKKIKMKKITKDHLDTLIATNNENKARPSKFKSTERKRLMEVAHHDVVDGFAREQFPFLVPPGSMIPPKYLPAGHVDAVIYNIQKKITRSEKHLGHLVLMWRNEEETRFRVMDGDQLLELPISEDEEIDISVSTSGTLMFSTSDGSEITPTSLNLEDEYPNLEEDWKTYERNDCLKLYNAFSKINRQAPVEKKNEVLWEAAKEGDIDKITYAINVGAEINSKEPTAIIDPNEGKGKLSKLSSKAFAFVEKEVAKRKGRVSKEEDETNKEDKSALHYTAEAGNMECSYRLLELGATPNIEDKDLLTPLHLAARNGHLEVLELLCEAGADIRAQAGKGITARDITEDEKIKEYLTLRMDQADSK